MRKEITTQQLYELVEKLLARRKACPDANLPNTNLNPRLVGCDGPKLQLELAFDTKPWMTNPRGVVHGGIIAVLLDNSMGTTCSTLCGQVTPTISLNINYARPVPLNRTVVVRTQMMMLGRTSSQVSAQLYLPEEPERILVFGTGIYSTKAPDQPQA